MASSHGNFHGRPPFDSAVRPGQGAISVPSNKPNNPSSFQPHEFQSFTPHQRPFQSQINPSNLPPFDQTRQLNQPRIHQKRTYPTVQLQPQLQNTEIQQQRPILYHNEIQQQQRPNMYPNDIQQQRQSLYPNEIQQPGPNFHQSKIQQPLFSPVMSPYQMQPPADQSYNAPIQNPQMTNQDPNSISPSMMNLSLKSQNYSSVNILKGPTDLAAFDFPYQTIPLTSSKSENRSAICNPKFHQCTLNMVPQSSQLLSKCKLPFGVIVSPLRNLELNEHPVPIINTPQVVRCRRCRTYIHPWVLWVDQGTRWRCNVCFLSNDVPAFFDWNAEKNQPEDRYKRLELIHNVVEYIAPVEYLVRPPQPCIFYFIIDVSYAAVLSGMVQSAAKAIATILPLLPNLDGRTQIGFLCFDSSLHFFNLNPNNSSPQELVVSDLEDPFLPIPADLLVSIIESKDMIESLLNSLPDMFKFTQNSQNCLGKALLTAQKLMSPLGGKVLVLLNSLPNLDDGSLTIREDPSSLGTPKESALLKPAILFYKNLAVSCSPVHLSIDLFVFNTQYADIASLIGCAKYTGGSLYHFPSFSGSRAEDMDKLTAELRAVLTRPLGLEAVVRIRASRGLKLSPFHGNFFSSVN